MQGINAEPLTIVMDSVMDFSIFEVSITLFKYLNISILRYRNETFQILLQEVSLKSHECLIKVSLKSHESFMKVS